jgi:GntR family transcriptional regulator, transcriptional repressor for pyruvate dehydrogenase complex
MQRKIFENLNRKNAYEIVERAIRQEIFSGGLKLGERLPSERDMAEQFGVSRLVIREALRRLETAGLVTIRKGSYGGAFMAQEFDRPITEAISSILALKNTSLDDLFGARALIEPFITYKLAETREEEDLAELSKCLSEASEASLMGTGLRPYNMRFHQIILHRSGNPVLGAVGEAVLFVAGHYIEEIKINSGYGSEVLDLHKKILEAIRKKDKESARDLMELDIRRLAAYFSKIFTEESAITEREFLKL